MCCTGVCLLQVQRGKTVVVILTIFFWLGQFPTPNGTRRADRKWLAPTLKIGWVIFSCDFRQRKKRPDFQYLFLDSIKVSPRLEFYIISIESSQRSQNVGRLTKFPTAALAETDPTPELRRH